MPLNEAKQQSERREIAERAAEALEAGENAGKDNLKQTLLSLGKAAGGKTRPTGYICAPVVKKTLRRH